MDDLWSWAQDKAVVGAVKAVVKLGVTGAIAGGTLVLTQSLRRRGEIQTDERQGSTVQSPNILVVGLLCGLLSAGFLVWGVVDPVTLEGPGEAVAWILLITGFTIGFVVMAVYSSHRWSWDDTGLHWQGAFRSAHIPWAQLQKAGFAWDGQFVATSRTGKKIRWTNFALEHEAIMRAAQSRLAEAQADTTARQAA